MHLVDFEQVLGFSDQVRAFSSDFPGSHQIRAIAATVDVGQALANLVKEACRQFCIALRHFGAKATPPRLCLDVAQLEPDTILALRRHDSDMVQG